MKKDIFINKTKKVAIHKLGEKEICGYCFQTNKKHHAEYRRWAEVTKNQVVYDSSNNPVY